MAGGDPEFLLQNSSVSPFNGIDQATTASRNWSISTMTEISTCSSAAMRAHCLLQEHRHRSEPGLHLPAAQSLHVNTNQTYGDVTFVDINNDGDMDAFVSDSSGNTQYFQNTGTASSPSFAAAVTNPFGLSESDRTRRSRLRTSMGMATRMPSSATTLAISTTSRTPALPPARPSRSPARTFSIWRTSGPMPLPTSLTSTATAISTRSSGAAMASSRISRTWEPHRLRTLRWRRPTRSASPTLATTSISRGRRRWRWRCRPGGRQARRHDCLLQECRPHGGTAYSDTVTVKVTNGAGESYSETIGIQLGTAGNDTLTGTAGTDIIYGMDEAGTTRGSNLIVNGSFEALNNCRQQHLYLHVGVDGLERPHPADRRVLCLVRWHTGI